MLRSAPPAAAEQKPNASFMHLHPPLAAHPDFLGKSGGGLYADMLSEMDHRVGQIPDAVHTAGIKDNTIVVFSSDNATSSRDELRRSRSR